MLADQWGFSGTLEYAFLKSPKDNLYMVSRDIAKIDWTKFRINSVGIYFGELKRGLRLSIEGSQLVGPKSSKNVHELNSEEAMKWLKGHEIATKSKAEGYQILRSGKDFLGCGTIKDGNMLNFVPKIRRLPPSA